MGELIVAEHVYKPIVGELLLCGRQSLFAPMDDIVQMVKSKKVLRSRKDRFPPQSAPTDNWFFDLFTDAKFNAIDVSDYEGANIVHDMCTPAPDSLHERFSFIYNGSCMDNLSDSFSFLKNVSRMLAPGGVVMHIEHGSRVRGAYVMYSPDYFFDYYAVNGFEDCKVYAAVYNPANNHTSQRWSVFQWYPHGDEKASRIYGVDGVMVITIAEKGRGSTSDLSPLQFQYRQGIKAQIYAESEARFLASKRPGVVGAPKDRDVPVPPNNYPRFCGFL